MEGASPPMLWGTQANSKETIEWEKVSNNQNFFFIYQKTDLKYFKNGTWDAFRKFLKLLYT